MSDVPAAPAPRFDPARRRAVTLALLLVSALASFESTVVSTAMPTIIGDLGGLPLYAWVFSVYLLTSTIGMPVYGRLADVYGRRRVLLTSIGIFLTGALACAFAHTMWTLIAARALQGLGAGGMIPISLTVAADIYSLEQRARVQGFFSGVWGFASLAGPLAGGFLTDHFGWRSIFWINLPLGVIAFGIVASRLIESRATLADPIDIAGAAALAIGFALLLFGVLRAPSGTGEPPLLRAALVGSGLATLAGFIWLQTRRAHPLVPPELFRRWETASPYVAAILMGTTVYGVDAYVPLFVQGARGGTATAAGAVVTPFILMWAISAAAGARMVVRLGFRFTARLGALLALAGIALVLAGAVFNRGVTWMSIACGVIGSGLGPSSIAQVLAIQQVALERQRGIATSLVPFFRTVGGSLGVGALGGIFAAGLSARLGDQMEAASRFLAGSQRGVMGSAPLAPPLFRDAIERSLVPVFAVLVVLAAVNVFLTSGFPGKPVSPAEAPSPAEGMI